VACRRGLVPESDYPSPASPQHCEGFARSRDLPTSASLSTMNFTTMLRSRACSTIRWQSGIGVDGHWIFCDASAGSAAQLPGAPASPMCQLLMQLLTSLRVKLARTEKGCAGEAELNALKPTMRPAALLCCVLEMLKRPPQTRQTYHGDAEGGEGAGGSKVMWLLIGRTAVA